MSKLKWRFGDKPKKEGTYIITTMLIDEGKQFLQTKMAFFTEEGNWTQMLMEEGDDYDEQIIAYAEAPCFWNVKEFLEFIGGNDNE